MINHTVNIYRQLLQCLDQGHKAVLVTQMVGQDGCPGPTEPVLLQEGDIHQQDHQDTFPDPILTTALSTLSNGQLKLWEDERRGLMLAEPFFPEPHLIVFGGGHIAIPLVAFAAQTGFKVTIIDDRPTFANVSRFPAADTVVCDSFANSFNRVSINPSTFVVIITRGHRHDTFCLSETLKYKAAYVGMIGSRRRVQMVRDQLLDEGFDKDALDQVQSPIGLSIGAVTPAEIAISILAQLISFRRQVQPSSSHHPVSTASDVHGLEFDRQVIDQLAKQPDDSLAIITIIDTKGSVPRKTGAKMLIFADGRTLGSIGGGCNEGEVIIAARNLIRSGGHLMMRVDMTGQAAEDEGMVCGGIMDVLIHVPFFRIVSSKK